jgi:hypothetical protein
LPGRTLVLLLSNALGVLVASVVLKGMKVSDASRRTSA